MSDLSREFKEHLRTTRRQRDDMLRNLKDGKEADRILTYALYYHSVDTLFKDARFKNDEAVKREKFLFNVKDTLGTLLNAEASAGRDHKDSSLVALQLPLYRRH